jgi:hypothetical protein
MDVNTAETLEEFYDRNETVIHSAYKEAETEGEYSFPILNNCLNRIMIIENPFMFNSRKESRCTSDIPQRFGILPKWGSRNLRRDKWESHRRFGCIHC